MHGPPVCFGLDYVGSSKRDSGQTSLRYLLRTVPAVLHVWIRNNTRFCYFICLIYRDDCFTEAKAKLVCNSLPNGDGTVESRPYNDDL